MTREEMRDRLAEAILEDLRVTARPFDWEPDDDDRQAASELAEAVTHAVVWPEIERQRDEVRREIDEDIIIPERRMHEETIARAESAEAKQQAVADLIARYDDAPGDAYIPIGMLRDAHRVDRRGADMSDDQALADAIRAREAAEAEVDRLKRERAGWRSMAGVAEVEAERDALKAAAGRVRILARNPRTSQGRVENYVSAADVIAALEIRP